MELWKVHKFCESASLAELRAKREELRKALEQGRLSGANAATVLRIVQDYIDLNELFKED